MCRITHSSTCQFFFYQFEPQVFLFLLLFIHVLINCSLYTWQLLYTWPVKKAGNFPFQNWRKKKFPKYKFIGHNKLLTDSKRLLWYIFLFLTEHNPSFTLWLICSYFFTWCEFRCFYKVCSYIKKSAELNGCKILAQVDTRG